MQVIAIVNKKGGTGKTTTTANLGVALAEKGKRVLLLDMDPQGSLTYFMGVTEVHYDIANALAGDTGLVDTIIKKEKVDIVAASADLAKVELAMASFEAREFILKSLLQEVDGYDYVLIDCPPNGLLLQHNALVAADHTLVPLSMEVLNIKGLVQIINEIEEVKRSFNPKLNFLGVLRILFDKKKRRFKQESKSQHQLSTFIEDNLDLTLMDSAIRKDLEIATAPAHGRSVLGHAPKSSGAADYRALATEIIKKTRILDHQPA